LSKKETDVLSWLLRNGPEIAYRIAQGSQVGQSTVYATLRRLEQKHMIESRRLKGKEQTKKQREYTLTLRGLACVFIAVREKASRPIVQRWAHLLPLVLGKWSVFVEAGCEEYAQRRLLLASRQFIGLLVYGNGLVETELVGKYQEYFYGLVAEYLFPFQDGTCLRWLQTVCAVDTEVRDFVVQYFDVALPGLSKKIQDLLQDLKKLV